MGLIAPGVGEGADVGQERGHVWLVLVGDEGGGQAVEPGADAVGREGRRDIADLAADGRGFVGVAGVYEDASQGELAEGAAAYSIAMAERDGVAGVVLGGVELAELA